MPFDALVFLWVVYLQWESMTAQAKDEIWLPLMEYAVRKNLSLSTLRRYIKAGKVTFRLESGRYLIFDRETSGNGSVAFANGIISDDGHGVEVADLQSNVRRLETALKRAQEEIAELKTLIACYEERPPSSQIEV